MARPARRLRHSERRLRRLAARRLRWARAWGHGHAPRAGEKPVLALAPTARVGNLQQPTMIPWRRRASQPAEPLGCGGLRQLPQATYGTPDCRVQFDLPPLWRRSGGLMPRRTSDVLCGRPRELTLSPPGGVRRRVQLQQCVVFHDQPGLSDRFAWAVPARGPPALTAPSWRARTTAWVPLVAATRARPAVPYLAASAALAASPPPPRPPGAWLLRCLCYRSAPHRPALTPASPFVSSPIAAEGSLAAHAFTACAFHVARAALTGARTHQLPIPPALSSRSRGKQGWFLSASP